MVMNDIIITRARCPFDDTEYERDLIRLHAELPPVLKALRGAVHGLEPMCVAPTRTYREAAADNFAVAERLLKERRTENAKRAFWTAREGARGQEGPGEGGSHELSPAELARQNGW